MKQPPLVPGRARPRPVGKAQATESVRFLPKLSTGQVEGEEAVADIAREKAGRLE